MAAASSSSSPVLVRLVFQVWHDFSGEGKGVPDKWIESPRSIQERMPDWEYHLFTAQENDAFVQKHFPELWAWYRDLPHKIQQCDAIRYLRLYVHGGLYLDLDQVVLQHLEPLLLMEPGAVTLPETRTPSMSSISPLGNDLLYSCTPRHPLWLHMVEHMQQPAPWWCCTKHFQVLATTGPVGLSKVYRNEKRKGTLGPCRIIPIGMISPCSERMKDEEKTECRQERSIFLRELVGESWCSWDSRVVNFISHRKVYLIAGGVALLGAALGVVWWRLRKCRRRSSLKRCPTDQ